MSCDRPAGDQERTRVLRRPSAQIRPAAFPDLGGRKAGRGAQQSADGAQIAQTAAALLSPPATAPPAVGRRPVEAAESLAAVRLQARLILEQARAQADALTAESRAEAQREAERLMAESAREAEAIREKAQTAADELLTERAARAERLLADAQEALEAAKAEAEALMEGARTEAAIALKQAHTEAAALLEGAEEQTLDLSFALARQVLRIELAVRPEAIMPMLQAALARLKGERSPTLRVSPATLALLEAEGGRLRLELAGPGQLRLEAEPAMQPGDFIAEGQMGQVDGRLRRQLELLEESLRAEERSAWRSTEGGSGTGNGSG